MLCSQVYIMYVCLSNIHEENKNYVWVLEIFTFVDVIRLEIFLLFLTLLQHLFKSNCQKTFKFFFRYLRLLKTVLAFKISIFALVKPCFIKLLDVLNVNSANSIYREVYKVDI